MKTTNNHNALQDWVERVMRVLPTLSDSEFETRQLYTLVVAREGMEGAFTMVVNASDPATAARHATIALQAIPIPPQLDGRGPFSLADIFQGDVDLNRIDIRACSLAHLLPNE